MTQQRDPLIRANVHRLSAALWLWIAAVAFASGECPLSGAAASDARYSRDDVLAGRAAQSAAITRATLEVESERIEVAVLTDASREHLGADWPPFRSEARLILVGLSSGDVIWELLLSPQEASRETHAGDPRLSAPLGAAAVLHDAQGVAQRLYVGDLVGQVWRVDLPPLAHAPDAASNWQVDLLADLARKDPAAAVRFSLSPDLVRSVDADGEPFDGLVLTSAGATPGDPQGNGIFFLRDYAVDARPAEAAPLPVITWSDLALTTTAAPAETGAGWFAGFRNPAEVAQYRPLTDGGRVFLLTAVPAAECEPPPALAYVLNLTNGRPLVDTLPGTVAGVDWLAEPRLEGRDIVLPGRGIALQPVSGEAARYRARFSAAGVFARVSYWRDLLLDTD